MVLLSASVITKTGKPLACRQFVEMGRPRIEGLLAAFPRLIGKSAKQHTFVETDSVRYVYQPLLDKLFMVLITTKTSNILEDLEMLRLFAKVVAEFCTSLDENVVTSHALQLVLAFDEIVAMGYRENVTLAQIRTFVEMDSQEEKAYLAQRLNQEREAKLKMKEKAKELQRLRSESAKKGGMGSRGMGGGAGGGISSSGGFGSSSYTSSPAVSSETAPKTSSYTAAPTKPAGNSKALRLGTKTKEWDQFANQLQQEGERVQRGKMSTESKPQGNAMTAGDTTSQTPKEAVHLVCEEKVSCRLQREGGLQNMEIHGMLTLRISESDSALIRIQMTNKDPRNFQFNQHPNIDKDLFRNSSLIGLKAAGRPFPVNCDVGVLKWRLQTQEEGLVPLIVNCWVNDNGNGGCDCNIEYELNQTHLELNNVLIAIPVLTGSPVVSHCEGDYNYDSRKNVLEWRVQLIDSSNTSGNLEFTASGRPDDFFPVNVEFFSKTLFSTIAVEGVEHAESKQPVKYSLDTSFVAEADKYVVG